ncbi:hypothetical protein IWQ60_003425 [Tieghemiomyces parasiticus]|uniref:Uncharacterized protein n=1 Tax=Tieghemiomyces parasiticus TaxID=78921 RepID=A0A9W8A9M2_9FUNG|nr:hypothetical protein IWQ60_003425 [Tieghemiomyces parasiticus]
MNFPRGLARLPVRLAYLTRSGTPGRTQGYRPLPSRRVYGSAVATATATPAAPPTASLADHHPITPSDLPLVQQFDTDLQATLSAVDNLAERVRIRLTLLLQFHLTADAVDCWVEAHTARTPVDQHLSVQLLNQCFTAGYNVSFGTIFQALLDDHVVLPDEIFNTALEAYRRAGDLAATEALMKALVRDGQYSTYTLLRARLLYYAQLGDRPRILTYARLLNNHSAHLTIDDWVYLARVFTRFLDPVGLAWVERRVFRAHQRAGVALRPLRDPHLAYIALVDGYVRINELASVEELWTKIEPTDAISQPGVLLAFARAASQMRQNTFWNAQFVPTLDRLTTAEANSRLDGAFYSELALVLCYVDRPHRVHAILAKHFVGRWDDLSDAALQALYHASTNVSGPAHQRVSFPDLVAQESEVVQRRWAQCAQW